MKRMLAVLALLIGLGGAMLSAQTRVSVSLGFGAPFVPINPVRTATDTVTTTAIVTATPTAATSSTTAARRSSWCAPIATVVCSSSGGVRGAGITVGNEFGAVLPDARVIVAAVRRRRLAP